MASPRVERFLKMVQAHPDSPLPRFSLGQAYQDEGDFAAAIAQYERCIEAQADWPACLIALADCYVEIGEPEKAIPRLRDARTYANKQGHSSMAAEAEDKLEDLGAPVE